MFVTVGKVVELVMDRESKVFSFKTVRVVRDFEERYGLTYSAWNGYYNGRLELFLTDDMELLGTIIYEDTYMYEEVKAKEELVGKFGKSKWDPNADTKPSQINKIYFNGGILFYEDSNIYVLRIDKINHVFKPLYKINFNVNPAQLSLNSVVS